MNYLWLTESYKKIHEFRTKYSQEEIIRDIDEQFKDMIDEYDEGNLTVFNNYMTYLRTKMTRNKGSEITRYNIFVREKGYGQYAITNPITMNMGRSISNPYTV